MFQLKRNDHHTNHRGVNLMKSNEILWNPMKSYEIQWNPQKSDEINRKLIKSGGSIMKSDEIYWNIVKSKRKLMKSGGSIGLCDCVSLKETTTTQITGEWNLMKSTEIHRESQWELFVDLQVLLSSLTLMAIVDLHPKMHINISIWRSSHAPRHNLRGQKQV